MTEDADVQQEFARVQERWRRAINAHSMAPPDAGFSARLSELAAAAREEAEVCRKADAEGFAWPAHQANVPPPYELQPNTGRRGPDELWRAFDAAVAYVNHTGSTTNLLDVARAHDALADAAGRLADAVTREDRASGLLASPKRRRDTA